MFFNILLFLISLILFIVNLWAPASLSYAPKVMLLFDYLVVIFVSYFMVEYELRNYTKKCKQYAITFYMLSFCIGLFWLAFSWTPYLEPNYDNWGFDAQKYYVMAKDILVNGYTNWGLNYTGVVYFYLGVMAIFGIDPLVPFFFNSLISLYAVLIISRFFTERVLKNKNAIVYFVMLLVIPEVIYYNMMASREIICMCAVTVSVIKIGYFARYKKKIDLFISLLFILTLTAIRPPFSLAFILGIIIWTICTKGLKYRKLIMFMGAIVITVGFLLSNSLGSQTTEDEISNRVSDTMTGNIQKFEDNNYSSNSISLLLLPHNVFESVVFGTIRSFAYLVPSPYDLLHPIETIEHSLFFGGKVHSGLPSLTSFLMLIFIIPILKYIKNYKDISLGEQLTIVMFVVFFFVIGTFMTTFIHIRYRLVYDLLYFSLGINAMLLPKYRKRRKAILSAFYKLHFKYRT